ncbi:alpha amylase [Meredithblackwellia eburnea MCA 4105]
MATVTRGLDSWLKDATVYQIYPATFKDSNGDGVGDFQGILSKLDYLKDLGIDCIWISPFYKSPQVDLGYDISDFRDVHEPYGKLSDVDDIIKGCHERGMKVLADLVINHTSDLHEWFQESKKSKSNPKRDWYYWHPGKVVDGVRQPPTNWKSCFGGTVWEWDETTQEYYLHIFCKEQPDLNWENPETRRAIFDHAIKFWLDRGLDGFRIDTVNMYSKYTDWPQAPIVDPETPWQPAGDFFSNGPRLHEFLRMMNAEFAPYGAVSIGELPNTPTYRTVLPYIQRDAHQLDTVIQFGLAQIDHGLVINLLYREWKLSEFKHITWDSQQLVDPEHDAWAVSCLENHDLSRSVSRFGSEDPKYRVASAKMLATYLLSLSGTPIIYQGEELGMINIPKDVPLSEYQDVGTKGFWEEIEHAAKLDPSMIEKGLHGAQMLARDHARTPMQWTSEAPHGGFSTTKDSLWMRANPSFEYINAEQQVSDPDSVFSYYKTLLKLRKAHKDLFIHALFELAEPHREDTFVFVKVSGKQHMVVALNFTNETHPFSVPHSVETEVELVLTNLTKDGLKEQELRPWEARIYLPKVQTDDE